MDLCNDLDASQNQYGECKTSEAKRYIQYDYIYMNFHDDRNQIRNLLEWKLEEGDSMKSIIKEIWG